jgi:hypothetical protein
MYVYTYINAQIQSYVHSPVFTSCSYVVHKYVYMYHSSHVCMLVSFRARHNLFSHRALVHALLKKTYILVS